MPKNIVAQLEAKKQCEVVTMEDIEGKLVAEHNELIKAIAKMDRISLKLFVIVVGALKLDPDGQIHEDTVKISKQLIYDLLGTTGNSRGQRLEEQLQRLGRNAYFKFTAIDETTGKQVRHLMWPISHIFWADDDSKNAVMVKFSEDFLPLISDLHRNFTQYRLEEVVKLESKFAIVLYRIMSMNYNQYSYYLNKGGRSMKQLDALKNPVASLDEIKQLFDVTNKYKNLFDFERFTLRPAVKEINERTKFQVSYDKIRVGRRIGKLQFHISREDEQQLAQAPVVAASGKPKVDVADVASVMSNPYAGLLIASQLLDPVKVMTEEEYRNAIANRLFPAYDQFVKAHSRDLLERHIKYVGNHTIGTPARLVPYLLEALQKYEGQLQQADRKPAGAPRNNYQRKPKVTEKLPEWAKQTDAGERTEGPASEAQIQDSLDKLAEFRKSRRHE